MKKLWCVACSVLLGASILTGCGAGSKSGSSASASSSSSNQSNTEKANGTIKCRVPDKGKKWDKLEPCDLANEYSIAEAGDEYDADAAHIYTRFPNNRLNIGGGDFIIKTPGGDLSFADKSFKIDLFNSVGHINIKTVDDITGDLFYIDYEKAADKKMLYEAEDWDRFIKLAYRSNMKGVFQFGKEHFKDMKLETVTVPGATNRLRKFSFVNTETNGKEVYYSGVMVLSKHETIAIEKVKEGYIPYLYVTVLSCESNNQEQKAYIDDLLNQIIDAMTVYKKPPIQ